MPTAKAMKLFNFPGFIKLILFSWLMFHLFGLEWVQGLTPPMGLAPEYLLLFVGCFLVGDALNLSMPAFRRRGTKKKIK